MASPSAGEERPLLAIIIDDLGYELSAGLKVTELPGPIACAVLPGAPRAADLATAAHQSGKDVLLHLPLQAVEQNGNTEPGSILLDMSRGQFAETFATDIDAIPFVSGVNTHRGSLLTRHPGHMQWLMDEIAARGKLFFVDSYTTHESIALALAHESGVPAVKRDVFLDPDPSPETVRREFERLKKVAREQGMAVAIGHPYPATIELLQRELPKLEDEGFVLVSISELIARAQAKQSVQQSNPGQRR